MPIAEPPKWEEIEASPEYDSLTYEQKSGALDQWAQEVAQYAGEHFEGFNEEQAAPIAAFVDHKRQVLAQSQQVERIARVPGMVQQATEMALSQKPLAPEEQDNYRKWQQVVLGEEREPTDSEMSAYLAWRNSYQKSERPELPPSPDTRELKDYERHVRLQRMQEVAGKFPGFGPSTVPGGPSFKEGVDALSTHVLKSFNLAPSDFVQTKDQIWKAIKHAGLAEALGAGTIGLEDYKKGMQEDMIPPPAVEILTGIQKRVLETADFFGSPMFFSTLGIGAAPAGAKGLVTGLFLADVASNVKPEVDQLREAIKSGDKTQITEAVTGLAITGLFLKGLGKATYKDIKKAVNNASPQVEALSKALGKVATAKESAFEPTLYEVGPKRGVYEWRNLAPPENMPKTKAALAQTAAQTGQAQVQAAIEAAKPPAVPAAAVTSAAPTVAPDIRRKVATAIADKKNLSVEDASAVGATEIDMSEHGYVKSGNQYIFQAELPLQTKGLANAVRELRPSVVAATQPIPAVPRLGAEIREAEKRATASEAPTPSTPETPPIQPSPTPPVVPKVPKPKVPKPTKGGEALGKEKETLQGVATIQKAEPPAPTAPEAVIPPPPEPVVPRGTLEVINESPKVRFTAPKGATQVRVTDAQGRTATMPLTALKGTNPFRKAGITKIEPGTIDRTGKFQRSSEGEVTAEEVGKAKAPKPPKLEADLPASVKVEDSVKPLEPQAGEAETGAIIATIDVPNNRILVDRHVLNQALSRIPEERRQPFTESLLHHETVHLFTRKTFSNEEIADIWRKLTGFERRLLTKSYTGKFAGGKGLTDAQLGHEYVRRLMQWAQKVPVTEIAQARRLGYLSEHAINTALKVAHRVRSAIGGELAGKLKDMLDRLISKLETAKAAEMPTVTEDLIKGWKWGEEPQARTRHPEETEFTEWLRTTGRELVSKLGMATDSAIREMARTYTQTIYRPSFDKFSKMVRGEFGEAIMPDAIRLYEEELWRTLMKAPGKKLEDLRREVITGKEAVSPQYGEKPARIADQLGKGPVAEWKPGEKERLNVIGELGERLMQEARAERQKHPAGTVQPWDIAFERAPLTREGTDLPAYYEINANLARKPGLLRKLLLSGGQPDRSIPGVTSADTRRLVAVLDNKTGQVALISLYPSRGSIIARDPYSVKAKRLGVRLDVLIASRLATGAPRYTPIASLLIRDPVRNFAQIFPSEEAFIREIAIPARERLSSLQSETPETVEHGEMESLQRQFERHVLETEAETPRAWQLEEGYTGPEIPTEIAPRRIPLTDAEASALVDDFIAGKVTDIADLHSEWEAMTEEGRTNPETGEIRPLTPRERLVTNSIRKIMEQFKSDDPGANDLELFDRAMKWLYENGPKQVSPEARRAFVESAVARFAGQPVEKPALGAEWKAAEIREAERRTAEAVKPVEPEPPEAGVERFWDQVEALKPFGPLLKEEVEMRRRIQQQALDSWLNEREPLQPAHPEGRPLPKNEPTPADLDQEIVRLARGENVIEPRALLPIKSAAKTIDAAADQGLTWNRWFAEWSINRIARLGDKKAKEFAAKARAANGNAKTHHGSLSDVLDPAMKAAGSLGKVSTWANGTHLITKYAGTSRIRAAVEGLISAPGLAADYLGKFKAANLRIGQLLEAVIPGFKATGKWQTNITAEGMDMIRNLDFKKNVILKRWTQALLQANVGKQSMYKGKPVIITRGMIFKHLRDLQHELNAEFPDSTRIDRINQDFSRLLPVMITRVKAGGLWHEIVHDRPFNYLQHTSWKAAYIRAFREQFPIDKAFRKLIGDTQQELKNPGYNRDLRALVNALQGIPPDSYVSFGTTPAGVMATTALKNFSTLYKRMLLSAQMITQISEAVAGSPAIFFTPRVYLKALWKSWPNSDLFRRMEMQGKVDRVMYDFSFDPASPFSSLFRIGSNMLGRGFGENLLNEIQELQGAASASFLADEIRTGKYAAPVLGKKDAWEKEKYQAMFRAMNFSKADALAMVENRAPDPLKQFEMEASSWLSGGAKSMPEQSRLLMSRAFHMLMPFQTYSATRLNQFNGVLKTLTSTFADPKATPLAKKAALAQFGRFMGGITAQGALMSLFNSIAYYWLYGGQTWYADAKDHPWRTALEAAASTMSGPYFQILQAILRNEGPMDMIDRATNMFLPYTMTREMYNFAFGNDQYRDLSLPDKINKFFQLRTPGLRPLSAGLAVLGLTTRNLQLDAYKAAFYRWRYRQFGGTTSRENLRQDTKGMWRRHMKKAREYFEQGDLDKATDSVRDALDYSEARDPEKSIEQSVRGRKILKVESSPNVWRDLTEEELDLARQALGANIVDALQAADRQWEELGEAIAPPSRKKKGTPAFLRLR